jgi:hypothetical protein
MGQTPDDSFKQPRVYFGHLTRDSRQTVAGIISTIVQFMSLQIHRSFSWVITVAPIIIAPFQTRRGAEEIRADVLLFLLLSITFPEISLIDFILTLVDQK